MANVAKYWIKWLYVAKFKVNYTAKFWNKFSKHEFSHLVEKKYMFVV